MNEVDQEKSLHFSLDRFNNLSNSDKYITFLQALEENTKPQALIDHALQDLSFFTHPPVFLDLVAKVYPLLITIKPNVTQDELKWINQFRSLIANAIRDDNPDSDPIDNAIVMQKFTHNTTTSLDEWTGSIEHERGKHTHFSSAFLLFINKLFSLLKQTPFKKIQESFNATQEKLQSFNQFKEEYYQVVSEPQKSSMQNNPQSNEQLMPDPSKNR